MKLPPIFFLFIVLSLSINAQDLNFRNIPQIQTTAISSEEVFADKITLSIILSETDTKGKTDVETLEKRMKKVLLNNNININKQLFLTNMGSDFKDYFLKKNDILKVKNYQLELYKSTTAGKVLRELASQDISNIKLLKTEYSKLEELKTELKTKAVQKAKQQAEMIVKSLNQNLGPAIYISDTNINSYRTLSESNINLISLEPSTTQAKEDLNVNFNKIKVEAQVTVYFSLD